MSSERIDKVKAKLGVKTRELCIVLNSPAGKALLAELEAEFDGDLVGANELMTYRNLGAREVVRFLRDITTYNERTGT